jgi:hypothetical protein
VQVATPQAGFVEEIPERNRQELRQPRSQGMEKVWSRWPKTESDERMADFVSCPLGAVARVEAGDEEVMPKRAVLGLCQDAAQKPRLRPVAARGPRARWQWEGETMFEIREENLGLGAQLRDSQGGLRAVVLGIRCAVEMGTFGHAAR